MSMKALGVTATGNSAQIKSLTVPVPSINADDLLVKVSAFSLNPVDYKVRDGSVALLPPNLKITGWDASGVVEALGANVSNFKVGDEVYFAGALNRQGANAEYTAVDHRLVALKPNSVDHITASSMPLCALTAWEGFEDKLGIPLPTAANDAVAQSNASKSIIITAGAGGVGSIAIQLAKKVFKLGKVIAVSGRSESADWCRKMGADLVLDRSKDWKAQLEENGVKNGIHYALCVEVDDIFETLISILAPMGRICSVAVNHTPPSVSALFLKSISFDWEFMGSRPIFGYEVERHGQILSQLASLVDDGTITHWVGRTYHVASAETLRDGHDFQATGKAIGKIAYDAIFQ